MNNLVRKFLSVLVLAAAAASPVFAHAAIGPSAPVEHAGSLEVTGNIQKDVESALSNGASNVQVSVHDGVATLFGYTDSLSELAARRVAAAEPGVTSVVDLVQQIG